MGTIHSIAFRKVIPQQQREFQDSQGYSKRLSQNPKPNQPTPPKKKPKKKNKTKLHKQMILSIAVVILHMCIFCSLHRVHLPSPQVVHWSLSCLGHTSLSCTLHLLGVLSVTAADIETHRQLLRVCVNILTLSLLKEQACCRWCLLDLHLACYLHLQVIFTEQRMLGGQQPPLLLIRNLSFGVIFKIHTIGLEWWECLLLFQRTWVGFPTTWLPVFHNTCSGPRNPTVSLAQRQFTYCVLQFSVSINHSVCFAWFLWYCLFPILFRRFHCSCRDPAKLCVCVCVSQVTSTLCYESIHFCWAPLPTWAESFCLFCVCLLLVGHFLYGECMGLESDGVGERADSLVSATISLVGSVWSLTSLLWVVVSIIVTFSKGIWICPVYAPCCGQFVLGWRFPS